MPGLDRLPRCTDCRARFGAEFVVLQRVLELGLDVIFAALDLVDDRLIVLAGDGGLENEERAVRTGEDRAVIRRIAAELRHFGLKRIGDLATLGRAAGEHGGKAAVVGILGGFGIAVDAVDGRRDQAVERADVMAGIGHGVTPWFVVRS